MVVRTLLRPLFPSTLVLPPPFSSHFFISFSIFPRPYTCAFLSPSLAFLLPPFITIFHFLLLPLPCICFLLTSVSFVYLCFNLLLSPLSSPPRYRCEQVGDRRSAFQGSSESTAAVHHRSQGQRRPVDRQWRREVLEPFAFPLPSYLPSSFPSSLPPSPSLFPSCFFHPPFVNLSFSFYLSPSVYVSS